MTSSGFGEVEALLELKSSENVFYSIGEGSAKRCHYSRINNCVTCGCPLMNNFFNAINNINFA